MSNIPYTFTIACVAPKNKYPAAYPGGFLEMARSLLVGGDPYQPIVHVCGGMAHKYNNKCNWGYGPNDQRIDITLDVKPEIVMDVRFMDEHVKYDPMSLQIRTEGRFRKFKPFSAAIIDRDYNLENAARHATGVDTWPENLRKLTMDTFNLINPTGLVGVFDFKGPNLPQSEYRQLWNIAVLLPGGQQIRQFSVWQRKSTNQCYIK